MKSTLKMRKAEYSWVAYIESVGLLLRGKQNLTVPHNQAPRVPQVTHVQLLPVQSCQHGTITS